MTIYLYVKQHSVTRLKYFGKTTKQNPFKYNGSGKYWLEHIKKHGKNQVKTLEIWGFDDQELCTEFALKFSEDNNIVNDKNEQGKKIWANLRLENGVDGNPKGFFGARDTLQKISKNNIGKIIITDGSVEKRIFPHEQIPDNWWMGRSKNFIEKTSIALKGISRGKRHTDEFKLRQSIRMKSNNPMTIKSQETKIEYKGNTYFGWKNLKEKTGVSKKLYEKYYLINVDPEPYIGISNYYHIKKIIQLPIYHNKLHFKTLGDCTSVTS